MNIDEQISCTRFPCPDVRHDGYVIPGVSLDPQLISMLMISEAAPANPSDYFYASGVAAYERTSVEAFMQAGVDMDSFSELLGIGIYMTSAVKCAKTGYGIKAGTINECSSILEKEIGLFPNIQVIMLMGDVAIKSINYIARRAGEGRVIPAGPTYKIRGEKYSFRNMRLFPSYLQVGPSFGIEKSKRRMIAEDIKEAVAVIR
jgi:uracil-DNA glycosylase